MESKVVVITGASEGIGAELARQLGRELVMPGMVTTDFAKNVPELFTNPVDAEVSACYFRDVAAFKRIMG